MRPRGIAAVLSGQQGAYQWGVRDCLTTAAAAVRGALAREPNYAPWHALPEREALRRAIQQFGSLAAGHVSVLGAVPGVAVLSPAAGAPQPGDLVCLEGEIVAPGVAPWRTGSTRHLLGFVAPSCAIWTWTAAGIRPAGGDYEVTEVFRCLDS